MYETTPDRIWWNGQIVPWADARIHVTSEVATRGMNLFEGMRAYWWPEVGAHGVVYRDRHFVRLRDSARLTRMPPRAAQRWIEALRDGCDALLRDLGHRGDLYLRPTVYIDTGRYGWREEEVTLGAYVAAYPADELIGRPVRAIVSSWRRTPDSSISPLIKVGAAYQAFRLPRIEAAERGADEAIVLNQYDAVAETGGAALFMVRHGEVVTPPLADGVLDGITRAAVIRLLRTRLGRPVVERSVPRSELGIAEEIFLCGTLDEIRPVVSVDGLPIAEGPVGLAVREHYRAASRGLADPLDNDMIHLVPALSTTRSASGRPVTTPDGASDRWSFPVVVSPRVPPPADALASASAPKDKNGEERRGTRPVAVLFDVGLTLIHPSGEVIRDELAAVRPDLSPQPEYKILSAFVLAAEARHLPLPAGLDNETKVARMWGHYLGLAPHDADAVWARLMGRHDLYRELDPDAVVVLRRLRELGLAIAAVSNSDGTLVEEMRHFGLLDLVDEIVDSTVAGIEKPAREIYDLAVDRLGVAPAQCCFVGDGPLNDVAGAQRAGITTTVLYDRFNVHHHVPATLRLRELRELPPLIEAMSVAGTDCEGTIRA